MNWWKCLEEDCSDERMYHWKGLCKSCTGYDKEGKVITAVQRQEVTATGTKMVKPKPRPNPQPLTLQDMKTVRRQQKKLTKKQMEALRAAEAHTKRGYGDESHTCDDNCDHTPNDAQIMEIGESLGEEE